MSRLQSFFKEDAPHGLIACIPCRNVIGRRPAEVGRRKKCGVSGTMRRMRHGQFSGVRTADVPSDAEVWPQGGRESTPERSDAREKVRLRDVLCHAQGNARKNVDD